MRFEYTLSKEDVIYHDFDSFNESITRCRDDKFKKEYFLLKDNDIVVDIDNLTVLSDGLFKTNVNGVEFECIFKRKETKRLYVFFSGKRNPKEAIPIFKRWRYSNFVDGSTLNIADPMLRKFDKLSLGWYYGTNEEDYYLYLVRIIQQVAVFLGVENEDITFYASSGGGYAALQCGCRIEGCTVIAINSQIDLRLHDYAETFCAKTSNDIENDKYLRNHLAEKIIESERTRFLFVENCRSKEDMEQLECFCKKLNYRFMYGIQQIAANIMLWVYDAERLPAHSALDYPEIFFSIDNLAKNFEKPSEYKDIYEYITELWHEHYCLADKMKKQEKSNGALNEAVLEIAYKENVRGNDDLSCLKRWESLEKRGEKIYDFIGLFDAFRDNGLYMLSIGNVYSMDNSCDVYTIAIKNKRENKIVYRRSIQLNKAVLVVFKVNRDADKLELRLYPSRPNMTQGCCIAFECIRVYDLNDTLYAVN